VNEDYTYESEQTMNAGKRALFQARRFGLTAFLLGAVGLGLAACGGEASVAPTATTVAANSGVSTTTAGNIGTPVGATSASTPAGSADASCTKLDLNSVAQDQLMSGIPGFNSRWVREFQEYRPYSSILQFRQQLGKYTDQAQIAEWEKYVYVPIAPNDADVETLKQLPGVTDAVAQNLINAQPYASSQAFLDELAKNVSADQLAQARCYLAPESGE
jgi:DNA uptake protein ComE-like DNA-binding protein